MVRLNSRSGMRQKEAYGARRGEYEPLFEHKKTAYSFLPHARVGGVLVRERVPAPLRANQPFRAKRIESTRDLRAPERPE